jgi:hypothetical protein
LRKMKYRQLAIRVLILEVPKFVSTALMRCQGGRRELVKFVVAKNRTGSLEVLFFVGRRQGQFEHGGGRILVVGIRERLTSVRLSAS